MINRNSRFIWLVTLSVAIFSIGGCHHYIITGQVVDDNMLAINNATIADDGESNGTFTNISTTTDKRGRYEFDEHDADTAGTLFYGFDYKKKGYKTLNDYGDVEDGIPVIQHVMLAHNDSVQKSKFLTEDDEELFLYPEDTGACTDSFDTCSDTTATECFDDDRENEFIKDGNC